MYFLHMDHSSLAILCNQMQSKAHKYNIGCPLVDWLWTDLCSMALSMLHLLIFFFVLYTTYVCTRFDYEIFDIFSTSKGGGWTK